MQDNLKSRMIFCLVVIAAFLFVLVRWEMKFGLDLKGGAQLLFWVDYQKAEDDAEKLSQKLPPLNEVMNQITSVWDTRLNKTGLEEITIRQRGDDMVQIELPGASEEDMQQVKKLLARKGTLEFRLIAEFDSTGKAIDYDKFKDVDQWEDLPKLPGVAWREVEKPRGSQDAFVYHQRPSRDEKTDGERKGDLARFCPIIDLESSYYNKKDYVFKGSDISHVGPSAGQFGDPVISFSIRTGRDADFGRMTADYLHTKLAIVIDDKISQAPTIQGIITNQGQISGYHGKEMENLIIAIRHGSLPVAPDVLEEKLVGPGLGQDQIRQGSIAILAGFVSVILLMLWFYRACGVVATIALLVNLIIILGTLKLFGAVLTLPGIAGILLTVGMAVDSNILVFERMREEQNLGKTARQALLNGYSRATLTIIDANVTTLITAFILYQLGTGPIRGFAVTLAIGIFSTLFSALFVTRVVFDYLVQKKLLEKFNMRMGIPETNIRFMSMKGPAIAGSFALICIGIITLALIKGKFLGLDFSGGSLLHVSFSEPVDPSDLRSALDKHTLEDRSPKYPGLRILSTYAVDSEKSGGKSSDFEIATSSDDSDGLQSDLRDDFGEKLKPRGFKMEIFSDEDRKELAPQDPPKSVYITFTLLLSPKTTEAEVKAVTEKTNVSPNFSDVKITDDGLKNNDKYRQFTVNTRELTSANIYTGKNEAHSPAEKIDSFRAAFHKEMVDAGIKMPEPFPTISKVGPRQVSNLVHSAVQSFLLAFIGIILYVTFRFNRAWTYGVASVIALVHDVLVTVGLMALAVALGETALGKALDFNGIEFNMEIVGALLAIVGYSINDTIVIYDRIRENLQTKRRLSLTEAIDLSTNQTLRRSLLMSGTTLLPVIFLFLIGGKEMHSLAYCLICGILVGTYSSTFIAAALIVIWQGHKKEEETQAASKPAMESVATQQNSKS